MIEMGSAVKGFKVGDRVMFGMSSFGTIAEEIIVPYPHLVHVPDTLSYEEASGFMVGYITAYHGCVVAPSALIRRRIAFHLLGLSLEETLSLVSM